MYGISNNEHEDGRKSDIIYTAKDEKHSERTPPLLVEVQQKVDLSFIKRLTRYCLSMHDVHKVKPVVVVFVIQGFASKLFGTQTLLKTHKNPFTDANKIFVSKPVASIRSTAYPIKYLANRKWNQ